MNNEQQIEDFKKILSKYIKKDRVNHAYLIESNVDNKVILANELIKKIISFENKVTFDELEKNSDILLIDSDSNTIKTEEIETLKERLITTSTINNKRFYIINNAEKLNDSSSNKLLKFIEEPENDIIAIFLTNNKNKLLKTIISRCQILRFVIPINKFKEYEEEYIDSLFDFVINIEENKEEAIAYQNKYDVKKLSDRTYIQEFLNNILYIYDEALKYKIDKILDYFPSKEKEIEYISSNNTIDEIKIKINSIYSIISRLKYNPNIKLLVDKLIILMIGVE